MFGAGAAQAAVRVDNATAWLLATANGGIWHTKDLLASKPHWLQVLDGQPVACSSISAMEAKGKTLAINQFNLAVVQTGFMGLVTVAPSQLGKENASFCAAILD